MNEKIIIWVRHATVDYKSTNADTLTASGNDLAKNLPEIISNAGFEPDIILYASNTYHNDRGIKRCLDTVAAYRDKHVKMESYTYDEAAKIFEKYGEYKQIIICYTSETLWRFPSVKNSILTKYTGNGDEKVSEEDSCTLYKNIIITKCDDSGIHEIGKILTSDEKCN